MVIKRVPETLPPDVLKAMGAIDAQQASRVIDQLRPRLVVIPMHYRTAASTTFQLGTVEEFIANKTNVRRVEGNTLPLTAIKSRAAAEIVVLGWK